jgi:phytoene dehydrogenase-like protein
VRAHADVIVVGAGLTGLSCALALRGRGVEPLVLDAMERPGGRIRTDDRNGFLLDRGFQVLQTWYPAARELLDYESLDLRPFANGALVRFDGRLHRISDPLRRPAALPRMLFSPVGSLADKWRLLGLRRRALRGSLRELYERPESDALALLKGWGFSARMIERFFRPFFAGVFFDPELGVSSHAFEFVFRAFALGNTALPARGMGEIPAQLAARLPEGSLQLETPVARATGSGVVLEDGRRLRADAVVIATDTRSAGRLLGEQELPPTRGTTCFHFAADRPPVPGPDLVLNAGGRGLINSLLCPSNLSSHYAPRGRALVTVNVFGAERDPDGLEGPLRTELASWFGDQTHAWERLAVYRLPRALPGQAAPVPWPGTGWTRAGDRLWVAGEHSAPPSIHWALESGRGAGESVAAALGER